MQACAGGRRVKHLVGAHKRGNHLHTNYAFFFAMQQKINHLFEPSTIDYWPKECGPGSTSLISDQGKNGRLRFRRQFVLQMSWSSAFLVHQWRRLDMFKKRSDMRWT
jgi:hypothetical protein